MALRIDGKEISRQIKDELKEKVTNYKKQGVEITLAVIQVGNDLLHPLCSTQFY